MQNIMTKATIPTGNAKVVDRVEPSPPPSELSPTELIQVIESLIGWYQVRRSANLAFAITLYIETLGMHPDVLEIGDKFCKYERIYRKWNGLLSTDCVSVKELNAKKAIDCLDELCFTERYNAK